MGDNNVKISLAAAISLRFLPGRFWRDARSGCLNMLLDYSEGCRANCAYCGLARERVITTEEKSFIRVPWPSYPLKKILKRLEKYPVFSRVCLSMVVHPNAFEDTLAIISILKKEINIPISLLASPIVISKEKLFILKKSGVDRFTIAIDTATETLFKKHRGSNVQSPLEWSQYWQTLEWASTIFENGKIGAHWIVGMGESEENMVRSFLAIRSLGGKNHLFSFYPEEESALASMSPPPLKMYRRLQVARYLIDENIAEDNMIFSDKDEKITDFGLSQKDINKIIETGLAFRTSGCPAANGEVACNRPFGDSRPGPLLRNYPFSLDSKDIGRIKRQLGEIL